MVRSQSVSVTRKPDGLPADIPGGQDSGASAKAPILQDRVHPFIRDSLQIEQGLVRVAVEAEHGGEGWLGLQTGPACRHNRPAKAVAADCQQSSLHS